jgi:hypothetical protein
MISAVAGGIALLVSGCSSDSIFPAVHDMPAARVETTMTPDQVKQATDELNCERDHLSTEAQTNGPAAAPAQPKPAGVQKTSSCGQPTATPAVATQPVNAYARP